MKLLYWLNGPKGLTVVAIGLVAITISLFIFVLVDFQILLTGTLPALNLRLTWYLLLGVVASLFSAICVFSWRPMVARIAIALFSLSMATHVVERLVHLPTATLRALSICRLLVSLGVIFLFLSYRRSERRGPIQNGVVK